MFSHEFTNRSFTVIRAFVAFFIIYMQNCGHIEHGVKADKTNNSFAFTGNYSYYCSLNLSTIPRMVAMKTYLPGFHHFFAECFRPFAAINSISCHLPAIRLTLLVEGIKGGIEKRREEKEATSK